ncbi:MAG TPA: hypothetical protein VF193_05805 [Steroidobacter sp.]
MTSPDVPEAVWQFIAEKIDTVPQLEALLLLWENPNRAWTAGEMAQRIYVKPEAAAQILEALQRRQLASAEGEEEVRYRYNPGWDTKGTLMAEVVRAYRRHLVPIATFIHSGASSSVREFARAFNLKKER